MLYRAIVLAIAVPSTALPADAQRAPVTATADHRLTVAPEIMALYTKALALDAEGKAAESIAQIDAAIALAARTRPGSESHAAGLSMIAGHLAPYDLKRAIASLHEAVRLRTPLHGARSILVLRDRAALAIFAGITGDSATELREVAALVAELASLSAETGAHRDDLVEFRSIYLNRLFGNGDEVAARREADAMLVTLESSPAVTPKVAIDAYQLVGRVDLAAGRLERAVTYTGRSVALGRQVFGDTNPMLIMSLLHHGKALIASNDYTAGDKVYREALALADATRPPKPHVQFTLLQLLGRLYLQLGRYDIALRFQDRMLAIAPSVHVGFDALISAHSDRAITLQRAGRSAEAVVAARAALAESRKPDKQNELADAARSLAAMLLAQGQADEARGLVAEFIAINAQRYPAGDWRHVRATIANAQLAVADKENRRAAELYGTALAQLRDAPASERDRTTTPHAAALVFHDLKQPRAAWLAAREAADLSTAAILDRQQVSAADPIASQLDIPIFDRALDMARAYEVAGSLAR